MAMPASAAPTGASVTRRSLLVLYLAIVTLIVLPILGLLHLGADLPPPTGQVVAERAAAAVAPADPGPIGGLAHNLEHPLSRLFVQLLVIIVAARLAGTLFASFGQPAVVGEMAAGMRPRRSRSCSRPPRSTC